MQIVGAVLYWAMLLGSASTFAAAEVLPFQQRLGELVPHDLRLRDEVGREVAFDAFLGHGAVLLVPGYFHCPNLCATVLDGVLQGAARAGIEAEIVAVSIDPREGPREALEKRTTYARLLPADRLHFLTGDGEQTQGFAKAIGFPYVWDAALGQYLHPAGFLLLTPTGRIARYFIGVAVDADSLREAAVRAGEGRVDIAAIGFALGCAPNDSSSGRYNDVVLGALRVLGIGSAAGFAWWLLGRGKRS